VLLALTWLALFFKRRLNWDEREVMDGDTEKQVSEVAKVSNGDLGLSVPSSSSVLSLHAGNRLLYAP
jgi:hypothetical protein